MSIKRRIVHPCGHPTVYSFSSETKALEFCNKVRTQLCFRCRGEGLHEATEAKTLAMQLIAKVSNSSK